MKEFLFVFRGDFSGIANRTPEEMQASTQHWMNWISGIAAQNKLADRGSSLKGTGTVVRAGQVVTDGPYTELKETLGGYSIVKAGSMEEAIALAEGCPVFNMGGSVEIREINVL